MASTTEPTVLKKEEEEEDEKPLADDEDTGAQIAPIVQLQEIAVTTGEENEDIILDLISNQFIEVDLDCLIFPFCVNVVFDSVC
ncbi:hypothetical protein MIMGU_mgv1a0129772mg, partial [Erythranthe guttata]